MYDVGGPVDSKNMLNGNAHLAQDAQKIKSRVCARLPDWGNKGPGFWFAVFLSLLSILGFNLAE